MKRWVLRLSQYNLSVEHVPGKENISDYLSRLCDWLSDSASLIYIGGRPLKDLLICQFAWLKLTPFHWMRSSTQRDAMMISFHDLILGPSLTQSLLIVMAILQKWSLSPALINREGKVIVSLSSLRTLLNSILA